MPSKKLTASALRALEDENGRLSPDIVVKAAENPDSPLHDYFEWDDAKAAHAHRLQQARQLIRVVQYEFKEDKHVLSTVRYVKDPESKGQGQGYVSLDQIKSEPENAQSMIDTELERVLSLLARVEMLARAMKMQEDVHLVSKQVRALKARFLKVAA